MNLAKELRDRGVNLKEVRGWQTRSNGGNFNPIGVMQHHTAGVNSLNIITNGRAGIPGPLSQFLIEKNGIVRLVSQNGANHAGRGNSSVLARTREKLAPLGDARTPGDIIGNAHYWGIEVENLGNGRDPYPDAQIQSLIRLNWALCDIFGYHPNQIIHHREWTSRKIDMSWRGDIRGLVANFDENAPIPQAPQIQFNHATTVIRQGDRGIAVRELQEALNELGYDAGPVDAIFGPRVDRAVKAFQSDEKITVDGIVGPQTWGRLDAKIRKEEPTPEPKPEPKPAPKPEPKEEPQKEFKSPFTDICLRQILRQGMRGSCIATLQNTLNKLGYAAGVADGIAGPRTHAAILAFQRANGLRADGLVGPVSFNKMHELLK